MDIIFLINTLFLIIAFLLFFTYSNIVTSRFILILNELQMTKAQIIIIIILSHIGYFFGVTIYDIAKKFNMMKFFIGGSIFFASLQIMLNYSQNDFQSISIIGLLLFGSYNLVDLCCGTLMQKVPFMLTVFLRNLGALIATAINTRINYVSGIKGKNLVLYMCCGSIISFLFTNMMVENSSHQNIRMFDLYLIYKEYSSIFWSAICINLIDILLLKYLGYALLIINNNAAYALKLELIFYFGRLILHYPMIILFYYFKSKVKIIILQTLNLISLVALPILYFYNYYNTSLFIMFFMGGFSLLRHGVSIYFNEIKRQEHIALLDVALTKIRSLCLLLAFLIEIIFIAGWNIGAYIILILFQIISIGGLIFL
jgi:hypothetical protein